MEDPKTEKKQKPQASNVVPCEVIQINVAGRATGEYNRETGVITVTKRNGERYDISVHSANTKRVYW